MARAILDRGWSDVRPLRGGFDAWRQKGYPTEEKPPHTQSIAEVAANIRKAEGDDDADVA